MSRLIDTQYMRAPVDLLLTDASPKRLLIVGSCLSEAFVQFLRASVNGCDIDLLPFGEPIDVPPRSIDNYDFQIIQTPLRFVLPDMMLAKLSQQDFAGHKALFDLAIARMRQYMQYAMHWNRNNGILTFVFGFFVPVQNPVGRLLPRFDLRNPVFFVEKLNEALAESLADYRNAFYFDLDEIASHFGRKYIQDDVTFMTNHGGFLTNFDFEYDSQRLELSDKTTDLHKEEVRPFLRASWQELLSMYRTVMQIDAIKMVVVDLDDTLWRGITAELEPEQLPTSEGWPKGLWEALAFLKRRGIILAIVSKNDEERVRGFWDRIFLDYLKIEDFSVVKINWRSKVENMGEILLAVNILPLSVLYIDDNPVERAAIKQSYPQIRVLGGSPISWRRLLLWSSETQVAKITGESSQRTEMIRAQVMRDGDSKTLSHLDFLSTLDLRIELSEIRDLDDVLFPRALELINKTNQFNTTGQRWSHENCVKAFATETKFVVFNVMDRFTNYGLTGVAIVKGNCIAQFVMSCRVLGLGIEFSVIAEICRMLKVAGYPELFATFTRTDRNDRCQNLYAQCGFAEIDGDWRRSLLTMPNIPKHIELRPLPEAQNFTDKAASLIGLRLRGRRTRGQSPRVGP